MKNILKFLVIIFFVFTNVALANVSNLQITPEKSFVGQTIIMKGNANPNEVLSTSVIYTKTLNIDQNGKYEYILDNIYIPSNAKSFKVSFKKVKNLDLSVKKFGISLPTVSVNAKNNVATISTNHVISGEYTIKLSGDAADGESSVVITITATSEITADSSGNFEYSLSSSGFPEGEYVLNIGNTQEKIILSPIVTLSQISTQSTANNIDKFKMLLTAKDSNGNPVNGATFTIFSNRTQDTVIPNTVTTNSSGNAEFYVKSTKSGIAKITAKYINVDVASSNILFVAGNITNIILNTKSTYSVADNIDKFNMILTAKDNYGNRVKDAVITLKSNRTQDKIPLSVKTNETGNAEFYVTSTKSGIAKITASYSSVNNSSNILFVPGTAYKLAIFGPDSVTGVKDIKEIIAVQDRFGNNVTSANLDTQILTASITSGNAGITSQNPLTISSVNATDKMFNGIPYNATYNSYFTITASQIGAGNVTIEVTSNKVLGASKDVFFYNSINNLNISLNKTTMKADNGKDAVLVTVVLKDSDGNYVKTSGVEITLGSSTPELFEIPPSKTTDSNGIAKFVVRSKTKSGSGKIRATVTLNPAGGTGQTGESDTITLEQTYNIQNSNVANTTSIITAGGSSRIIATVNDYDSKPIKNIQVTFNIISGDAKFSDGSSKYTGISDNDGKVSVSITSTNASTIIKVNVTIDNKRIGDIQKFTVKPSSISKLMIQPNSVGLKNVKGANTDFNITTRDKFGNINTTSIKLNVTNSNPSLGNISVGNTYTNNNLSLITSNGKATFKFTVNDTKTGTSILTVTALKKYNPELNDDISTKAKLTTSGPGGLIISFNKDKPVVGQSVKIYAQLTDSEMRPIDISGIEITFTIVKEGEVIPIYVSTSNTNSSGIATYNMNIATPGNYSVTASSYIYQISNSSSISYIGNMVKIIATVNDSNDTYTTPLNSTVIINATAIDKLGNIATGTTGTVIFLINGTISIGSSEFKNGVASIKYTPLKASLLFGSKPGRYTIMAYFNSTIYDTVDIIFTSGSLAIINVSPSYVKIHKLITQNFTATGYDINGNEVLITPIWSSSNTLVGTIDESGVFTPTGKTGNTTITATNSSVIGTAIVKVLIGDINRDGTVNYTDLGMLGASYGLSKGDPGYNSEADLNNDGIVNYTDLGMLGLHYGESEQ